MKYFIIAALVLLFALVAKADFVEGNCYLGYIHKEPVAFKILRAYGQNIYKVKMSDESIKKVVMSGNPIQISCAVVDEP